MAELIFFNSPTWTVVIISLLIFCSRIIDVGIGTIRIVYISRGRKYIAPILGFFEVLLWLIVVNQVMSNLNNPIYYVCYALGFSAGTFIGMLIEDRLNDGKVLIRIITQKSGRELEESLEKIKLGSISSVNGTSSNHITGKSHDVKIIFLVINRKRLKETLEILKDYDPKANYSVGDVRYATEDFNNGPITTKTKEKSFFGFLKKSK